MTLPLNNLLSLYEYFWKKVHVKKQTGGVFCYLINDLLLTALLNLQKKADSALVSKSQFPPTKKSRDAAIGKLGEPSGLTLIGMRQGRFTPIIIFGLDFVS